MIKRPTWILLGVLVLAVGAYFAVKKFPLKSSQPTPTPTGTPYLITSADGTLTILKIKASTGEVFSMQRNTANNWVITAPRTGDADQGQAASAATQVGALAILNTLDMPTDLTSFQLSSPADTINLTFNTGIQHTVEVGGLTPTSSGYYVRFDGKNLYVVSKSGIDALLNLLKSPPFPATPTPSASETPAGTPTLGPPTATP